MEEVKEVEYEEVAEGPRPQLEIGNYVIEIKSKNQTLKKIAVANAEVYITKLSEGGLVVDLK